eukprot:Gb_32873 [translate_table: standard]
MANCREKRNGNSRHTFVLSWLMILDLKASKVPSFIRDERTSCGVTGEEPIGLFCLSNFQNPFPSIRSVSFRTTAKQHTEILLDLRVMSEEESSKRRLQCRPLEATLHTRLPRAKKIKLKI